MKPIIIIAIVIAFLFVPQNAFADTEYNIYIDELPEWASYASDVMYESTKFWEEVDPSLKFYQVDSQVLADFSVQWVKEFGVEHVGYAFGNQFLEVGLGDSNCVPNRWQPYSSNYVSQIMKHEIGHILGYEHNLDDPADIMYPIIVNTEYGLVEQTLAFTENYAWFVPICTSKEITSFNYQIDIEDPTYGFDVYFVLSADSIDRWGEGKPFEYYADSSCYGTNYIEFGGTCENVSSESGLLISTNELSQPLVNVNVKMQEITTDTNQEAFSPAPSPSDSVFDSDTILNVAKSYNLYSDPQNRFSMKYPSTWLIDDQIFDDYVIGFLDKENWNSSLNVHYYPNMEYTNYSDGKILDEIESLERGICNDSSYDIDGFVCYNFQLIDKMSEQLDSGEKAFVLAYTITKQYSDPLFPGEYDLVISVVEVHDDEDVWLIFSETDSFAFESYFDNLSESSESFKLTKQSKVNTDKENPLAIPAPTYEPPTGEIISSENLGTAMVDYDTYVIKPYEKTNIKIHGKMNDANSGDRVALTYTYPDGTTDGNLVFVTNQGNYEAFLILDVDSPSGEYEVLVTMKRKIVGVLTFDVIHETLDSSSVLNIPKPAETIVEEPKQIGILEPVKEKIPDWIKNNAGWWADGSIDDDSFVQGIQFLIKEGIMQIPPTAQGLGSGTNEIPSWIKNNAGWWANGDISEDDFVSGIEFLVKTGIIKVN